MEAILSRPQCVKSVSEYLINIEPKVFSTWVGGAVHKDSKQIDWLPEYVLLS